MMNKQRLDELYNRYITDRLSEAELTDFYRMLDDPANERELHRLFEQWWETAADGQTASTDAEGQRRIQQVMNRVKPVRPSFRLRRLWFGAAAACAVCLAILPLLWKTADTTPAEAQVNTHEITTALGQRKTVHLPDRSVIHLNAGSRLQYTDDYSVGSRDVKIDGEAFFEVVPDTARPFTVRHGQLCITVLGTAFNVNAVAEASITVSVSSGLVEVRDDAGSPSTHDGVNTRLAPGQQLAYDKTTRRATVSQIQDIKVLTAWKNGVLAMQDLPFADVADLLQRWYGVDIIFNEAILKTCRFTGEFDNLPINKVLDLLAKSSGFTYRITEKTIYIDGGNCY
ncbi:FecR family protein [Parapedobacter deserti]|uniref:FecR family protein n=1 Tax=Parapedobacter deserti TaxID=1912957 RepID=A0ABV7JR39_9SPHI